MSEQGARPRTRPDLRLVATATACWLAALVAPAWSPQVGYVVGAALAAIALLAVRRRTWLVAGALGCAAAACLGVAVRAQLRRDSPLRILAARDAVAELEVTVIGDPQPQQSRVVGARRLDGGVLVRVRVERLRSGDRAWRLRQPALVIADAGGWAVRIPGERVAMTARLALPLHDDVAAVLRPRGPPRVLAGAGLLDRIAARLRAGLRAAAAPLPAAERGLVPGLVDGDTTELPVALREQFRRSGLSHLFAVSGTNCTIVIAAALALVRRLRLARLLGLTLAAAALGGFVLVARPGPSVLRAAVMAVLSLVAVASGRQRRVLPALAASVLVLLLADPSLARSAGFALSVAATAGIVVFVPPLSAWLGRRWPPWLADAVAVPLAAQLACAPVLAAVFGTMSLVAVPANLLAMPAVGVATLAGVCAALLAPVTLDVARLAARVGGVPAHWLATVARVMSEIPRGQLRVPTGLAGAVTAVGLSVAAVWVCRRAPVRRAAAASIAGVALATVGVATVAPGWPMAHWTLVACDVGQGDALVLRAGGSTVMVDTGPDPEAAAGCLADLGVRRISAVVLTHLHADHVEGLPGVLRGRAVGEVQVGPLLEPPDEWDRVQRWTAAAHVPLRHVGVGEHWSSGALDVAVLGPVRVLHGTDSDPNNASLVLRVRAGPLALLLTGDAEQVAQDGVLGSRAELAADVLKVPHHGSAKQLSAFLAASDARVGIVSVGADNPYGHPAPTTIETLTADGQRVYRTDRDGDVAVAKEAGRLAVRGRRGSGRPPRPRQPLAWTVLPAAWNGWCPVRSSGGARDAARTRPIAASRAGRPAERPP